MTWRTQYANCYYHSGTDKPSVWAWADIRIWQRFIFFYFWRLYFDNLVHNLDWLILTWYLGFICLNDTSMCNCTPKTLFFCVASFYKSLICYICLVKKVSVDSFLQKPSHQAVTRLTRVHFITTARIFFFSHANLPNFPEAVWQKTEANLPHWHLCGKYNFAVHGTEAFNIIWKQCH